MLRKIAAHLAIIFGGMCFVLFVVDAIKRGAMSFINNDMTKAFIAILSLLAIFNSVLSLTAQTIEKQLHARLTQYRRRFGALPQDSRPAQPAARPVQQRPAQPRPTQARPAQQRPVQQRPVQARPSGTQTAPRTRSPYTTNR